ncbi:hypothetical protein CEXT_155411 [Caerostris extrusa]|uniref:Uncharacterized protein n=1 Tax=Caerostris extrusa TaxID=172846 RepID=A0AAV4WZS6_CAEEX|nr:hypothetical protein CEXT_155411 [Caerostris extrusa]
MFEEQLQQRLKVMQCGNHQSKLRDNENSLVLPLSQRNRPTKFAMGLRTDQELQCASKTASKTSSLIQTYEKLKTAITGTAMPSNSGLM